MKKVLGYAFCAAFWLGAFWLGGITLLGIILAISAAAILWGMFKRRVALAGVQFAKNIRGPGGLKMDVVQNGGVSYVVTTERVILPAPAGDEILSVVVKHPEMDLSNPEMILLFKQDADMDEMHKGVVHLIETYPRGQWEEARAKINPDVDLRELCAYLRIGTPTH
jgi:hypothetical protein